MVLAQMTKSPRSHLFHGKRRWAAVALGVSLLFSTASADLLQKKPGALTVEGVPLATTVTLQSNGKSVTLKPYASGLLRKKVAFFWAKVYVGQIFAPEGLVVPPISIAEARLELAKQPVVAVIMTFVRDVDLGRLRDGFGDTLRTNSLDPESVEIKPLFEILERGGPAEKFRSITIVFERAPDGSESLRFENGKSELQSAKLSSGAIAKILSIWFGQPAHSGMESLHRQFLGLEKR